MMDRNLPPGIANRLEQILKTEDANRIGRIAVRRGFITEEQLKIALDIQSTPANPADGAGPRPIGAILVAHRWIQPADLISLMEEQRQEETQRYGKAKRPAVPDEVTALLNDPTRQLAEFVLVSRLGQGGAGEVWKAWDRHLRRWVAVKICASLPGPRDAWNRFHSEAMLAARLNHRNIAPIYRVAEQEGRPYIVMQLVEGQALTERRFPLDKALKIIRTAALTVEYAHQQGVIHRDLKPGNIMVSGRENVWVLDFGLAQLLHGAGDSGSLSSRSIAGTPAYMSPEQARGDAQAHRPPTDIYGLGATLYDLATGYPPYEGASFTDVVNKVLSEDPPPPRRINSRLPRDVEAIILKAMARDPRRRYASAGDLAEDLRRCLEHEPVSVRAGSPAYRFSRHIGRNFLAYAAALTMVASAVLGVTGAYRLHREQDVSLQALRDGFQSSVESVLNVRRAGRNSEMGRYRDRLKETYRKIVDRAPRLAEADFLMGRFHRALMEEDAALEFQERALSKDARYVPALYERAILKSRQCRSKPEKPARLREEVRRDAEKLHLHGGLDEARTLGMMGLLAYLDGQHDEAVDLLTKAVRKDDSLEECWETLAQATEAGAWASPDVEAKWTAAENTYAEAILRDRGYLPHYLGRGTLHSERGLYRMRIEKDPLEDWKRAEEDFAAVVRLAPSRAEGWIQRARVRHHRGLYRKDHGLDPLEDFTGAEKDRSEALKINPNEKVFE